MIGTTNCPDELVDDMFQMGTFGNSNKHNSVATLFIAKLLAAWLE